MNHRGSKSGPQWQSFADSHLTPPFSGVKVMTLEKIGAHRIRGYIWPDRNGMEGGE